MQIAVIWIWKAALLAAIVGLLFTAPVRAQSVSALHHFGTKPGDPIWFREMGLIAEGADGNLYSTSPQGGKFNNQGTIFKVTPDGNLTVLYDFDGKTGASPRGGLTKGSDGHFYGTTYTGGKYGVGTIFRITTAGQFSVLYHFRNGYMYDLPKKDCSKLPCVFTTRQRLDASASYPTSAPVFGSDGNLYGVTPYSWNQKYGVLYRISPGGGEDAFSVLCTGGSLPSGRDTTDVQLRTQCMFNGVTIGNHPISMLLASDGNFYGTTYGGLPANPHGTVFKASPGGQVSTLHQFNLTNGSGPLSVMEVKDGSDWNLYGTTAAGGNGNGVVYKLTPGGAPTVLHKFSVTDGLAPVSGLVQAEDGKLYGATKYGGGGGKGVLYRISPSGTDFQVLHHFDTFGTGRLPLSTPLRHTNKTLYGLTYQGGIKDAGALYCMALPPSPKEFVPHTRLYKLLHNDEQIRLETGVSWTNPSPVCGSEITDQALTALADGIAITAKCTQKPQVVQFVHREQVLVDGTLEGGPQELTTPTCKNEFKYCRTTNPAQPQWRTDTSAKLDPYYGGYRINCDKSLTAFDAPTLKDFDPKRYRLWRATFVSFVLCDGEVIRQIRWKRERKGSDPLGLFYEVGKPTPPDPELVKQLQCISTKEGFNQWAPAFSSPTVTCSAPTIPDEITGTGCPTGP